MGVAKRSSPDLGTSESIYDDLRIIRSRGGFDRAAPDDLEGTLNSDRFRVLPEERRFDAALAELRSYTERYLQSYAEDDDPAAGSRMAAESLKTLLLSKSLPTGYEQIRSEIGGKFARGSDFVRDEEDKLLRACGRAFLQMQARVDVDADDQYHAFEHLGRRAADIKAPILDFAYEAQAAAGREDKVPVTDRMQVHVERLLYCTGVFFCALDEVAPLIPPSWDWMIRSLAEQLWPAPLQGSENQRQRWELVDRAEATRPYPQNFVVDIRANIDLVKVVEQIAERYAKRISAMRYGIASDFELTILDVYMTAHNIGSLALWIADGKPGNVPPDWTDRRNSEIIEIVNRGSTCGGNDGKYWKTELKRQT